MNVFDLIDPETIMNVMKPVLKNIDIHFDPIGDYKVKVTFTNRLNDLKSEMTEEIPCKYTADELLKKILEIF